MDQATSAPVYLSFYYYDAHTTRYFISCDLGMVVIDADDIYYTRRAILCVPS